MVMLLISSLLLIDCVILLAVPTGQTSAELSQCPPGWYSPDGTGGPVHSRPRIRPPSVGKCWKVHFDLNPVTFYDALTVCEHLYTTNAHSERWPVPRLVTLKSATDLAAFQHFVNNVTALLATGGYVWLGAHRKPHTVSRQHVKEIVNNSSMASDRNDFQWLDGFNTPMEYLNWAPGQPDNLDRRENCVTMSTYSRNASFDGDDGGRWSDDSCVFKFRVVCEIDIRSRLSGNSNNLLGGISGGYQHLPLNWSPFSLSSDTKWIWFINVPILVILVLTVTILTAMVVKLRAKLAVVGRAFERHRLECFVRGSHHHTNYDLYPFMDATRSASYHQLNDRQDLLRPIITTTVPVVEIHRQCQSEVFPGSQPKPNGDPPEVVPPPLPAPNASQHPHVYHNTQTSTSSREEML